jgi:hypothetical protein
MVDRRSPGYLYQTLGLVCLPTRKGNVLCAKA